MVEQAVTEIKAARIKKLKEEKKKKLKQTENEMLKKHTKIMAFLKSKTGKINKDQETVEERIQGEVCTSVEKEHVLEER